MEASESTKTVVYNYDTTRINETVEGALDTFIPQLTLVQEHSLRSVVVDSNDSVGVGALRLRLREGRVCGVRVEAAA